MSLKEDIDVLKWMSIVEEEINVKSDRALIITIASILDIQLEKLLKNFMINNSKIDENLFKGNAPLSTFSSKISICYNLGLISKYEYQTIEIIKKIRNRFAHDIEIKKMTDNQAIMDLCNKLTIPKKLYIPPTLIFTNTGKLKKIDTEPLSNIDISTKLVKVFKNLTMYLEYRIIEISEFKRKEYENVSCLQLLKDMKKRIIEINKKMYNLNLKYKDTLLLELDTPNRDSNEIEKIQKEIQKIDNAIKAYEDGNMFFGTIVESIANPHIFMKILDDSIEAIESDESYSDSQE